MFTKRSMFIQVIGIVLVCSSATLVESMSHGTDSAAEPEGSYYYNLNLIRAIKLGTAPLFNVELAKRSVLAYSFNAAAVSSLGEDRIDRLYQSRVLIPAGMRDGVVYVPLLSNPGSQQLTEIIIQLERDDYEVVYLALTERLPDGPEATGNSVVSWNPIHGSTPLPLSQMR